MPANSIRSDKIATRDCKAISDLSPAMKLTANCLLHRRSCALTSCSRQFYFRHSVKWQTTLNSSKGKPSRATNERIHSRKNRHQTARNRRRVRTNGFIQALRAVTHPADENNCRSSSCGCSSSSPSPSPPPLPWLSPQAKRAFLPYMGAASDALVFSCHTRYTRLLHMPAECHAALHRFIYVMTEALIFVNVDVK